MMNRKLLIVSLLSATLLGSNPIIVSAQVRERSSQSWSGQNRSSAPQQRAVNVRQASDNRRSQAENRPAQRTEQRQNRAISGESRSYAPQRGATGANDARTPARPAYRQDANRDQGQQPRNDGATRNAQNPARNAQNPTRNTQNQTNATRQWQDQRGNRYDRGAISNRTINNRNYAATNWNNRSPGGTQRYNWNQNWRQDQRYNWQSYRNRNQNRYRYNYVAPRGWDYGYRRFSIGVSLWGGLFGSSYWISDPYYYRLPPAYGDLRWIRYYDDAMLVDIRSGYVVDVIYNFFW